MLRPGLTTSLVDGGMRVVPHARVHADVLRCHCIHGGAVSIESIGPADRTAVAPVGAPPDARASSEQFAAVLTRHLDRPRSQIANVRAEIAALRGGGALFAPQTAIPTVDSPAAEPVRQTKDLAALAARYATGDAADPYGWREMARNTAETVIGPGYGWLFERQIGQESGYDPEVVLGMRRSSAGAEGIAQLMPQYYSNVERTDPQAALIAGAETMRHYLTAWDGDVRHALASYNAGLGRVRSLVEAHGENWESALPAETRLYLSEILGSDAPHYDPLGTHDAAVFGGRGPGGVLSAPVASVSASDAGPGWIDLTAQGGDAVTAPSDGRVVSITPAGGFYSMVIDHGNGWRSSLFGMQRVTAQVGDALSRGQSLGVLAGANEAAARLRVGLAFNGRALDPRRYLLPN